MSSPGYFKDIQTRIQKFVESGQLGIFKNGYWDSPAYKLSPEADLMAVTHYLEALDFQKEIVKIHAIFGGKNPHPNYMVGGVPCAINIDGDMAAGAPINMERLNFVKDKIQEARRFNTNVYVPDVIAIAAFYKDWMYGGGLAATDVMDYGAYPKFKAINPLTSYPAVPLLGATGQPFTLWIHVILNRFKSLSVTHGTATQTKPKGFTHGMALPNQTINWVTKPLAAKPTLQKSMNPQNTPGLNLLAGAAMRLK